MLPFQEQHRLYRVDSPRDRGNSLTERSLPMALSSTRLAPTTNAPEPVGY